MNFHECIDWGMTKWTAKEQGKTIGDKSIKTNSTMLPVDKLDKKSSSTTKGASKSRK